jgi:alkanesulfonate monooxygenase SsuD/methylene tetrahydromethanopterin reductase-like flavin-dependent oxidoreductase (luciferase family)
MRLGINMPFVRADGDVLTAKDIMVRARTIEDAGFDGIWIGDAIGRMRLTRPDPLMWLLPAAATNHIEVGTAILQVPLRNPVDLAVRLMTMHAQTGHRFVAGVGAGSTLEDFDAAGVDFERRFQILSDSLELIRRLLDGEKVGAADLNPWPSSKGGPPVLVGAWASGRWLKRCVDEFDGWIASGGRTNLKTLREGIKRYRDLGGKRAVVATVPVDLTAETTRLQDDGCSICAATRRRRQRD